MNKNSGISGWDSVSSNSRAAVGQLVEALVVPHAERHVAHLALEAGLVPDLEEGNDTGQQVAQRGLAVSGVRIPLSPRGKKQGQE